MLSFKNDELSEFLTDEQIVEICPAAAKNEPTNPGVSGRYVHANSMTVVHDLKKLGWFPVAAKQCRGKKGSRGIRSFHMIAFQNKDVKIEGNGGVGEYVEAYPRIIMTNSHDGFNSFKFMLGLFRLVCSNGLVVCDKKFSDISIKHINYDFESLRDVVKTSIESVPEIVNKMNTMRNTILNDEQKKELATAVVKIRKNVEDSEKIELSEKTIMDILNPVRDVDKSNDLWTVFNLCQEKMIRGGYADMSKNKKLRNQRGIISIKKDIDFNKKLWEVAERMIPAEVTA